VGDELDLLVGDAERTSAASELRDHYTAGRLTLEEFEARLDSIHSARTEADLRAAFRQLPATKRPTLSPRDLRWRSLAAQYLVLNVAAVAVWLAAGAQGDFWPRWVFVATLIMFARRAAGRGRRHARGLPSRPRQLPGRGGGPD
jgi:hypothetical protein